jgi:hypothetical protein
MLLGLVLPLLARAHPLWETDRDCGTVAVGTTHAITQLEPVYPAEDGGHCIFCHWLRAVGGASPSAAIGVIPGVGDASTDTARHDGPILTAAFDLKPSRAPPALLPS